MKDYRERARQRAAERRTSIWYKVAEGENTFRILPTPESETSDPVFIEYAVHRDVGPKKQYVRCGKDPVSGEGRCWICDSLIPKLKKAGKESRVALLTSRDICAVQVAKVDDDGKMTGPFIFNPSKTVADQLIASVFGSKKRDYVDPKKGYNLTLSRTGTGRNDTRYGIIEPDQEPTPVPSELIKKLKAFSDLKEIPAYDEAKQKAAYTGEDAVDEPDDEEEEEVDAEEETEEEEEEPKKPIGKKKKPAPEPEEEEEEEVEEVEEEEEPKAKGKKKKPEPEPEEEEEEDVDLDDLEAEEEEEEPEPEEKPKGKKKKPEPEPEEEEEEVEEEEEEEEEEEPEPPKKSKLAPKPKRKK
jgi:hypothetical protein